MSRVLHFVLLVVVTSAAGEAALFDTAPMAHHLKTKTSPVTLNSGVSHRTTVDVDFSNRNGWDEEFDLSNETPTFDLASLAGMTPGTQVTVVGIGWDLSVQVQNFSWFSESVIKFGDELTSPSLFLQPGIGDDFDSASPMSYSSGGIINLAANSLPNMVLTDGVVEVEIYELLDDAIDMIDASYLADSKLTFDLLNVGVPDGDFDDDGDYACADVDALVLEIVNGTNSPGFDLTGDGSVNGDDLSAWLSEAGAVENASGNPYLPGDADLSGVVDMLDLNVWSTNRLSSNPAWCLGDFDASGVIDFLDFNIWAGHRFQSSAVPEPSSITMLLIVMMAGVVGRRGKPRA